MFKRTASDFQRISIAIVGALILSTVSVGAAVWPGHEAQFAAPAYATAAPATDRALA